MEFNELVLKIILLKIQNICTKRRQIIDEGMGIEDYLSYFSIRRFHIFDNLLDSLQFTSFRMSLKIVFKISHLPISDPH